MSCPAEPQTPGRTPSKYNAFIKEAMKRDDVRAFPHHLRMKAAAILWQIEKKKSPE